MGLLYHMGDRQLGVTGTMRQNRIHGLPLPSKKEVTKNFERGQLHAMYSMDTTMVVWKDNQPVYMASTVTVWSPWAPASGTARRRRSIWQSPSPT